MRWLPDGNLEFLGRLDNQVPPQIAHCICRLAMQRHRPRMLVLAKAAFQTALAEQPLLRLRQHAV